MDAAIMDSMHTKGDWTMTANKQSKQDRRELLALEVRQAAHELGM
jgi:hypothetical protein